MYVIYIQTPINESYYIHVLDYLYKKGDILNGIKLGITLYNIYNMIY